MRNLTKLHGASWPVHCYADPYVESQHKILQQSVLRYSSLCERSIIWARLFSPCASMSLVCVQPCHYYYQLSFLRPHLVGFTTALQEQPTRTAVLELLCPSHNLAHVKIAHIRRLVNYSHFQHVNFENWLLLFIYTYISNEPRGVKPSIDNWEPASHQQATAQNCSIKRLTHSSQTEAHILPLQPWRERMCSSGEGGVVVA